MADQSSTRFDVPKINDSNYPIWKIKMHIILVNGCAIVVERNDKKDKDITNAQFDEKGNMAIANVLLALDDSILFNMSNQTIAKGMWEKIKEYL